MDNALYKKLTTRRGYDYSYYFSPSTEGKINILFLAGFPSTSHDWEAQVAFFVKKGYGVLAPDLLGYGDSSKPKDANEYRTVPIVNDIIDILDAEKLVKVITVGHDWGCLLTSRLVNLAPERLYAIALLAVGYVPPQPTFSYEKYIEIMTKVTGGPVFGYWDYFASEDASTQSEKHIDSFYDLLFPNDPEIWKTDLSPFGKSQEWIEQNKRTAIAPFWDEKIRRIHQERLLKGGLRGPMNSYTVLRNGLNSEDEAKIPTEAYQIPVPVFFGGALKDYVCLPEMGKKRLMDFAHDVTAKDFNTSHWIPFEAPDELNAALEGFIKAKIST